jgi:hypothetical protein
MAKPKRIRESLQRLAAAEERFLASEFLAPVFGSRLVQVRIAGVICRLKASPDDFRGFGVFRPQSHMEAELVRTARLAERLRYLELFPAVRLILAAKHGDDWEALPANRSDARFRVDGLVPVALVEDAQLFEVIEARFDGTRFWFAGPDPRWYPATGAYLRESLHKEVDPASLRRPGLTAEEREAYAFAFQATERARRKSEEERMRAALAHAGADFRELREHHDVVTIAFEVDGQRHVSVVSRKDLSVQVAGICLSGQDAAFDLQSLVGVIRESQNEGALVRVGQENQGMAEEQYGRVHPRRRGP